MWRFVALAALGLLIGSRARSERGVVVVSLFFGLVYGGAAVASTAMIAGPPSTGRIVLSLVLGLVLAAPVYAIAELWRRTRHRTVAWLKRRFRS
jgi:hypothetical protein